MPSWRERLALSIAPKEVRSLTANDAIRGLWASMSTSTGLRVDEKSSLQVIAVFTAVKILSEGFAQVPLKVYRANGDDSRTEVRQHPMYGLLHDWCNPRMTAFAMREFWMVCLALWGNSYTQIIRNNRGDVTELWPLNPASTRAHRTPDGRIVYRTYVNSDPSGYTAGAEEIVLPESEVFHIRGFSIDGLNGLSPIAMIRENVALSSAYTEYGAKFFGNGGVPGFILSTDKPMQQQQLDLAHKEWEERYQGLMNAQKVAILHGGLKPEKIGIAPEDAQFLESRQFEREEIFSFYRIPPNFYSANRITSWGSGIKEMSVGFVKFTLDPWFVRVENAINATFFASAAQGPLFPEFDREGFLRGDFPTRIQGYKDLFNMGVISNVGIARIENMPAPPTEVWLVPSNMVPIDRIDAIAEQQAAPPPAPVAPAADAGTGAEAGTGNSEYNAHHTKTDLGKFVRSYVSTFQHRQETAPQSLEREIVRAGNAFVYAAYRASGATDLVWVAGDDCAECQALDGQTRTFEDRHPPLCDDCRCIVLAHGQTRSEASVSPVTINNYPAATPVTLTVEPAQVKIEQAAQEAPTVNVTTPEVTVNVPAPPPAEVTVNVPEQKAAEYPEQKAPIVNVTVSPTPVTVRNEVKTPEVRIENTIDASPKGDITLEYDEAQGRLKKLSRKKS